MDAAHESLERDPVEARLERVQLLLDSRRYEDARHELMAAIGERPEWAYPRALLAIVLHEEDKHDEAVHAAREAIGLAPDDVFAHSVLGLAYIGKGAPKPALKSIAEARRIDPDDTFAIRMEANAHAQLANWKQVLESAEAGLAIDPEDVMLTNLRAMALSRVGQADHASAALDAALHRDPDNAFTHANRGWALMHEGDYKGAMVAFREALRLDPQNEWARHGILEAMKAGTFIYRPMLRYFLWMGKLPQNVQLMLIVGVFILGRVIRVARERFPDYAGVLGAAMLVYLGFIYLTWTANTMFNVTLRFHPFGKYVLSDRQRHAATVVGVLLLGAASAVCWAFYVDDLRGLIAAGVFLLMVIPVSNVSEMPPGRGRLVLSGYTAVLAVLGLGAILLPVPLNYTLAGAFVLGAVLYTWVATAYAVVR